MKVPLAYPVLGGPLNIWIVLLWYRIQLLSKVVLNTFQLVCLLMWACLDGQWALTESVLHLHLAKHLPNFNYKPDYEDRKG